MVRQGDVLLIPVTSAPRGAEIPRGDGHVLVRGAATKHAHTLRGAVRLYESAATSDQDAAFGARIVDAEGPFALRHETEAGAETREHDTIRRNSGTYLAVTQSQYQRGAVRNVED